MQFRITASDALLRHRSRNIAPCGISAYGNPRYIDPQNVTFFRDPIDRCEEIFAPSIEVVLRHEAITYGNHYTSSLPCDVSAHCIRSVQVAHKKTAAIAPNKSGLRTYDAAWHENSQFDLPRWALEEVFFDSCDWSSTAHCEG
jgi:hypothetical protein